MGVPWNYVDSLVFILIESSSYYFFFLSQYLFVWSKSYVCTSFHIYFFVCLQDILFISLVMGVLLPILSLHVVLLVNLLLTLSLLYLFYLFYPSPCRASSPITSPCLFSPLSVSYLCYLLVPLSMSNLSCIFPSLFMPYIFCLLLPLSMSCLCCLLPAIFLP